MHGGARKYLQMAIYFVAGMKKRLTWSSEYGRLGNRSDVAGTAGGGVILMAKKAHIRHGARAGAGRARPHVVRVAQEAATAALNEHIRDHTVEILNFKDEAELYLDGECIAREIPPIVRIRLETILAKIGAETRSFTVVVHNHSGLSRE